MTLLRTYPEKCLVVSTENVRSRPCIISASSTKDSIENNCSPGLVGLVRHDSLPIIGAVLPQNMLHRVVRVQEEISGRP